MRPQLGASRGLLLASSVLGLGMQGSPGPSAPRMLVTLVPARGCDEAQGPAHDREPARDWEKGGPLPDGSRIVLLDLEKPSAGAVPLTAEWLAAGRADLSDDGERFLFVGRRGPGDAFQVYEASLAGGEPRQVTHRTGDCLEAIYLSTLFTIDAERPEPRICFRGVAEDGVSSLHTCRLDGGDERRITFQPHGAASPLLLADGRLLFVGSLSPAPSASTGLFTINTDGTDVQAFAAVEAGAFRTSPCETPDGRVIYVEERAKGTAGSALLSVSGIRSRRSRQEILRVSSGQLRDPAVLPDGSLVVSWRPDSAGSTFDLFRLDASAAEGLEKLYSTDAWNEIQAVPIHSRARRPGRSSVVDERASHGFLYCMDAFLWDLEPGQRIPAERARQVEIIAAGSETAQERVLGTFPVEQDGSFYLQVPARTPLRLRLLDGEGRETRAMTSWIWVMPKEARGCIGCHEDPEITPPNRHTQALRKPACEVKR
jgi:hypothetical protein